MRREKKKKEKKRGKEEVNNRDFIPKHQGNDSNLLYKLCM